MNFPNATKVKIGSKPNHSEHNSLARAFNARILSGIGDCAWRIFYYAFSTFRGVRNPNGTNYAQEDEWFKFYGNIEPKMSFGKFGWPETLAGQPEGANVANPFMAWIFGNAANVTAPNGTKDTSGDELTGEEAKDVGKKKIHGYWSEPIRLGGLEKSFSAFVPQNTYGDPNLNIAWHDSENQRGCIAFVENFRYSISKPQEAPQFKTKTLELLSLGVVGAARKHLRFVMESPILGRYAPSFVPDSKGKGGIFRKKSAEKDQVGQAMFYYLSYFRGTEDQRAKHNLNGNDVTTDGFDFETFFSKQFLLAPNYSLPNYERNGIYHNVLKDEFDNGKIKYDSSGYPELYPDPPLFKTTWPLRNSEAHNKQLIRAGFFDFFSYDSMTSIETDPLVITYEFASSRRFNTNPNPKLNLNKFCISSILIQTSDLAVKYEQDSDLLLNDFAIEVMVNDKLYETIPLTSNCKYQTNRTTAKLNTALVKVTQQYYTYQFNKIHHFQYPIKGIVSFKVKLSDGIDIGLRVNNVKISESEYLKIDEFKILIKVAHVLEMKPTPADAYVMMRLATTNGAGEEAGEMDPVGHFNADLAQKVFSNYEKFGVAYNLFGKTLAANEMYVSANPVYESLRKFISSHIKMADRYSLVDYEVNSSNQSVLYFKRFSLGMKNTGIDSFRGVGPSITQVGNRSMLGRETETFIPITQGKEYIVLDLDKSTTSFIHYMQGDKLTIFRHGSRFVGGHYYYVSYFSDIRIQVFELDGIISEKLLFKASSTSILVNEVEQKSPGLITNEWSMFMSYNLYHPAYSSYWKPDMYGDIMGALNARCLTGSDTLKYYELTSQNVKFHLANVNWRRWGSKPFVVTSPSAYNYIEGSNFLAANKDRETLKKFITSCPIYQKPYYIESTTRVNPNDPKCEIIKVTLSDRLRGENNEVTGKVSENRHKWQAILAGQESRSDENAVIGYLLINFLGQHCKREVIGDVALNNDGFWTGQRPWGCCHPRFYFTKLIPYVAPNTVMYSDHYRQMEYYLRAMCNGFVNEKSELTLNEVEQVIGGSEGYKSGEAEYGGYDSVIGDYLFEHLMANPYDNSNTDKTPVSSNMASGGGGS